MIHTHWRILSVHYILHDLLRRGRPYYQVPENASVQHIDFVERQSDTFCVSATWLEPSLVTLLYLLGVFLNFILVSLVDGVQAEKGPSQELLDVLSLDFRDWTVLEPFRQKVIKVRHASHASNKLLSPLYTWNEFRMRCRILEMTSEGKEDYDIESGLYESPGNQEGPKRESIRSAWLEA